MPRPRSPHLARALSLVLQGATIRTAAAAVGIAPSTVARAVKESARPICPCCGQIIASPRTAATEE